MNSFTPTHPTERTITRIPIDSIRTDSCQSNRRFSKDSIAGLAESIRQHGLLCPILVRRIDAGQYELIAGERRVRALLLLNRTHANAIILSAFDRECALLTLTENLQRENLHFLDEAEACGKVMEQYSIPPEKLAESLSINPSVLANRLRLLTLSEDIRNAIREKHLSERHARALLRLSNPDHQMELIRECSEKHLSVKQLENRIDQLHGILPCRPRVSPIIRDNRIIINAVMDTVKDLQRIGVHIESHIEERETSVEIVIRIPAIRTD